MRISSLMLALVTSLSFIGVTSSCTSTSEPPSNTIAAKLAERSFLLEEATGYEPVAGTDIWLNFGVIALGFNAGCNTHSGPYEISNATLLMSGMGSTLMACAAALAAQDAWLATFFQSDPTIALDGNTLTLKSGDATLIFLDREVADPDRPLAGPTWSVDTLLTGDAASSIMTTLTNPTVAFKDDGSLLVETGCNAGTGSYVATAADLTFTGVSFTASTCTDAAAASMLAVLVGVFTDGTATYSIEAARLTIERGDVGVMAVATE